MTYLLSFDIEDWFHAHNIRPAVARDEWDDIKPRVAGNTRRILDILDKNDRKATFFVLGWVAERNPDLVRDIDQRGHEVASHGYGHELLYELTSDEIRDDIRRSKAILDELVEEEVTGYRAPSFSITDESIEILTDLGFEYDSSSFAVSEHDRYGSLTLPSSNSIVSFDNGLQEVTLPRLDAGLTVPWAGGGYFRFLPYRLFCKGVRRIARRRPFVFYLHPWDIDPDQPKQSEIPLSYQVRHYTNLNKTEPRLERLISEFKWEPIRSHLQNSMRE